VLTAVSVLKNTEAWRKEGGRFIPHPENWLNRKGWLEADGLPKPPSEEEIAARKAKADAHAKEVAEIIRKEQAERYEKLTGKPYNG
jgi:hypothetical protein